MKELDKTKAYDLRDLNDEQLKELLEWLQKEEPKSNWDYFNKSTSFIYFNNEWYESYNLDSLEDFYNEVINAQTLFEPTLKIGDIFEHDGFICEVKEPVKKWVYNSIENSYYKTNKLDDLRVNVITDKEFIKQLEKYAK